MYHLNDFLELQSSRYSGQSRIESFETLLEIDECLALYTSPYRLFLSTRCMANCIKTTCVACLNEKLNNRHLTSSKDSFKDIVIHHVSIANSRKIKMLMSPLPLEKSFVEILPQNLQPLC